MKSDKEAAEEKEKQSKAVQKTFLRDQAKVYGDDIVIEVAQG